MSTPAAAGWRAQGTAAYRAEDLAGALAAYTRAAADTPDDPVLWNNIAVVLWRLDEVSMAARAATEAITLRPDYPEAEKNRRLFATLGGSEVAPRDHRVRFLAALLARRARARAVAAEPAAAVAPAVSQPGVSLPRAVVRAARARPPAVEVGKRPAARPPAAAPAPRAPRAPGAVAAEDHGDRVPAAILRLPPAAPEVVLVDKAAHRLYLFRGTATGPRVVTSVPCVVGKRPGRKARRDDLRTPEGVYFLERQLDGRRLPELYGAMAYPTDYPNSFDHLDGREGGGIWLHGTDDPARLTTRDDSRGCVVVDNADLDRLAASIRARRTPMVVVPEIVWLAPEVARGRAETLTAWLDGWRREWQEGEWIGYCGRYAAGFFRLGHTSSGRWLARKRAFLAAEGERRIEVGEITLLSAAGQTVAIFEQGYHSPRRRDRGVKRVYLAGAGEDYRIVAEQWIPTPGPGARLASRASQVAPRS